MNYSSLSKKDFNNLAKQYEPLVCKITYQFSSKTRVSWYDIKSMAYEGLALAFEKYDPERSKMSFTQYAAFAIRNNILTSLDNELRTVKMSNYAQKKAIEHGEAVFNSVSIDRPTRDDESHSVELKLNMFYNEKFSDGDVFEYLYTRLEDQFNDRDCKIFYKSYGLHDEDIMKGKEIAKEMGVSEGLVSNRNKKIIEWIRKDTNLCEVLANLLK